MGQMRFVIPRPEQVVAGAVEQAYLASQDGVPWECYTTLSEASLVIERDTRESGYLYFPWLVAKRGMVQLCSGSLMERQRPYNLPIELARGTLNRLRNQVHTWQTQGVTISDTFYSSLNAATTAFSQAATHQDDPPLSQQQADEAIRLGLDAADILCRDYTKQVLALRRSQQPASGILIGARLQGPLADDYAARFLSACNMATVATPWPQVEPRQGEFEWSETDRLVAWCHEHNVRLCMGPLLVMDKHALPDWLFLDDGFEEVQASILKFIEAVVKRYRGKVQLWHVTARMNQDGAMRYSEEQRLRLVVEAVDRVRAIDPRTPLVVSFNQPWGEYIARKDQELTPLHFADTLIRGELGLAGVGLEIHYGYWPGGTLPRDAMEISRQLDRWSQIGVPLMVFVSVPSGAGDDELAQHPARPLPEAAPGGVTPAWQQFIAQRLLPMLLAKQPVQAIVWDPWQDNHPHEMWCGGLNDGFGKPKPALQTLIELKREFTG
jgi:hypothetical protein